MGANALNRSLQPKAVVMVLLMMLMVVPLTPVSTAADTNPDNLQAQHIAAVFDPVSETTTVSWQNIESVNANVVFYHDASYIVYRHTEPITTLTINEAQIVTTVSACDISLYSTAFKCLSSSGGGSGEHLGTLFLILLMPVQMTRSTTLLQ